MAEEKVRRNQTQTNAGVVQAQAHVKKERKKPVRRPPLERYTKEMSRIEKRLEVLEAYTKKLESRKEIIGMKLKVAEFETQLKNGAK